MSKQVEYPWVGGPRHHTISYEKYPDRIIAIPVKLKPAAYRSGQEFPDRAMAGHLEESDILYEQHRFSCGTREIKFYALKGITPDQAAEQLFDWMVECLKPSGDF